MAGFVSPILQGLMVLEDHKKQQAAEQAQKEEQIKRDLQQILVAKFMERVGQ